MIATIVHAEHPKNEGKHVRIVGETQGGALIVAPIDTLEGVDLNRPIYAYEGDLELIP